MGKILRLKPEEAALSKRNVSARLGGKVILYIKLRFIWIYRYGIDMKRSLLCLFKRQEMGQLV
jgi:hypothetical protein